MQRGVTSWDFALVGLGYNRVGNWREVPGGFQCSVEPVTIRPHGDSRPCNEDMCIASDCDGVHHVDATGRSFTTGDDEGDER